MQPLSSGETPVGMAADGRSSVLLPERSDRCNQPSCAFGGSQVENSLLTGRDCTPANSAGRERWRADMFQA